MPRIDAKSGGSGTVLASWLPGVRALTQRLLRRATPHRTVSGKFPFCPNALFCIFLDGGTSLWLRVYQWYTSFFPSFLSLSLLRLIAFVPAKMPSYPPPPRSVFHLPASVVDLRPTASATTTH